MFLLSVRRMMFLNPSLQARIAASHSHNFGCCEVICFDVMAANKEHLYCFFFFFFFPPTYEGNTLPYAHL